MALEKGYGLYLACDELERKDGRAKLSLLGKEVETEEHLALRLEGQPGKAYLFARVAGDGPDWEAGTVEMACYSDIPSIGSEPSMVPLTVPVDKRTGLPSVPHRTDISSEARVMAPA